MQNAPTTTHNDIATTWGPLILSALAIVGLFAAAFAHAIDWTAALGMIGAILGVNSLSGATRWQAAPGLLADVQAIIQQLAGHIQDLHSQNTPQIVTKIVPTPIVLPDGASPVPPRASAGDTSAQ